VKQPERYVPIEEVEDDYSDHEDIADSDVSSEISYDSDEDDCESEGSIKDFVVESEQDGGSSDDESDSDGEGSVS
jgi:hypothetical protein